MSIDEVIERVGQYRAKYITVTGGEPLAQSACLELMSRLADLGYQVSIETSGALDVSRIDDRVVKVMDLKTPSSGELHRNLFDNIAYLKPNDQVKFVIGDDHDYQWSKSIIDKYNLDQRCELLFSPTMGQQDPTELAEKILNDNLPVRFQIQLHKLLWNNVQGR